MAFNSRGEGITHLGAVTMRILGDGVMKMNIESLNPTAPNAIPTKELVGFQMVEATAIEPTRLTNYNAQRFRLHGFVDTIDEKFTISTIILWTKRTARDIPSIHSAVPTNYTP